MVEVKKFARFAAVCFVLTGSSFRSVGRLLTNGRLSTLPNCFPMCWICRVDMKPVQNPWCCSTKLSGLGGDQVAWWQGLSP